MRLFFGVGLPMGVRKEVWNFCSTIKEKLPKMKWVEEENLHITLRFLGEVEKEKLSTLVQLSDELSRAVKAFPVMLGSLGAFPNPKRARVFWCGLSEGGEGCTRLFNGLEARLQDFGFAPEDKVFHPHITLSRLNPPSTLAIENLSPPPVLSFTCDRFTLYESVLRPQGPLYKTIKEFILG